MAATGDMDSEAGRGLGRARDLTGMRFGALTVLRRSGTNNTNRGAVWEVRCECGRITHRSANTLVNGENRGVQQRCGACNSAERSARMMGHQNGFISRPTTAEDTLRFLDHEGIRGDLADAIRRELR